MTHTDEGADVGSVHPAVKAFVAGRASAHTKPGKPANMIRSTGDTLTRHNRVIAWRVDGNVYMMLGSESGLPFVWLQQLIHVTGAKGEYTNAGRGNFYNGNPVGVDQVIRLEV